jgi:hypothetical protein
VQAINAFEHFCSLFQKDDADNPGMKIWTYEKVT